MSENSIVRHPAVRLLRIAVAALLFVHGAARALAGAVAPFGEYLDSQGFPAGLAWAWAVTLVEVAGAPVLAAGRWVTPLAAYFILQLALGVAMVHWSQGWFVVGLGRNGMEYSALLIACLASIILAHRPRGAAVEGR